MTYIFSAVIKLFCAWLEWFAVESGNLPVGVGVRRRQLLDQLESQQEAIQFLLVVRHFLVLVRRIARSA